MNEKLMDFISTHVRHFYDIVDEHEVWYTSTEGWRIRAKGTEEWHGAYAVKGINALELKIHLETKILEHASCMYMLVSHITSEDRVKEYIDGWKAFEKTLIDTCTDLLKKDTLKVVEDNDE